jgi:hypothetical protein
MSTFADYLRERNMAPPVSATPRQDRAAVRRLPLAATRLAIPYNWYFVMGNTFYQLGLLKLREKCNNLEYGKRLYALAHTTVITDGDIRSAWDNQTSVEPPHPKVYNPFELALLHYKLYCRRTTGEAVVPIQGDEYTADQHVLYNTVSRNMSWALKRIALINLRLKGKEENNSCAIMYYSNAIKLDTYMDHMDLITKFDQSTRSFGEMNTETLRITKLPIGMWTNTYTDVLTKYVDNKLIESFTNVSTDTDVCFEVKVIFAGMVAALAQLVVWRQLGDELKDEIIRTIRE